MNIYHAIWEADMESNGIRPIFPTDKGEESDGYVVVNTEASSCEDPIFKKVQIPERKRHSYQLVEKLFDNYSLNQTKREENTKDESTEVEEFLRMAVDTLPIKTAKDFIEEKTETVFTGLQWFHYLHDLWFHQFDWESGKDLSGFEHIFIGDQKRRKMVGHHFWYKYWLEDNANLNKHRKDQLELTFNNHVINSASPYVMTIGYRLKAFDNDKKRFMNLHKKKCAFFVGISAEGLMALGTVRALAHKDVPEYIVFDSLCYTLELFKSPDGMRIRTFYPIIQGDPKSLTFGHPIF